MMYVPLHIFTITLQAFYNNSTSQIQALTRRHYSTPKDTIGTEPNLIHGDQGEPVRLTISLSKVLTKGER